MKVHDADAFYFDKCTVCDQPGSKTCGRCEMVYYCSKEHQKEDWHYHKSHCCKYNIAKWEHGPCMIAQKPIAAGELIATEYPLTIYNDFGIKTTNLQKILSVSGAISYPCPSCETGKIFCGKYHSCSQCRIPLCSQSCETSGIHAQLECFTLHKLGIKVSSKELLPEVLTDLAISRVFLKEELKGAPISFESRKWKTLLKLIFNQKLHGEQSDCVELPLCEDIINSLDAIDHLQMSLQISKSKELVVLMHCAMTAYGLQLPHDTTGRKVLFTKNNYLSHSCLPNAEMWIESSEHNYKLIIKAVCPIQPGQRISVNKIEKFFSLPTIVRSRKLEELGIKCCCRRCKDPTEFDTFLSGIRCEEGSKKTCAGYYVPNDPQNGYWKCSNNECKSIKSHSAVECLVKKVESELPPVTGGKADEVIRKLKTFVEYYSGDILCSSHYLIRVARSRMRQVVMHFFGSGEKLLLCVINDYPRAYEYCNTILQQCVGSMLSLVHRISPQFNELRGKLLYEKATVEFAICLYDYLVLRKVRTCALFDKFQKSLKMLKEAATSISIFSDSRVFSLKNKVNFMAAVINKILRGSVTENFGGGDGYKNQSLEKTLNRSFDLWKEKSREVGLATFYMEPGSKEHLISSEKLRDIIISSI